MNRRPERTKALDAGMSGLTCQQIVFVTKLADKLLFDHLICDGINADGGYVLASRVSVDFPESDLLQFFYRYQRLVHTGSSFSLHRRSTASGHGVLA
jgi:hypothetical protein